jgi:hypothetical protein
MGTRRRIRPLRLAAAAGLLACAGLAIAQIEGGDRGVAPVDSSGDFEVNGVRVDVAAKTADAARIGGWRLAQRRAWGQLTRRLGAGSPGLSDGALDQLVTAIVVEQEQIGPTRYVARLGVLFNRARVGALLGIATYSTRSSPMLVIPVQVSGGVGQVFETRTDWQQAWARFRTGNSTLDYVRPTGTGADPLLLNVGQIGRRSRSWWRTVVDQYGATDIVIPVVRLYRQWPGGPVVGAFQARWGADNRLLGSFSLRVASANGLPQLLDTGVGRIDAIYQAALRSGEMRQDPSLLPLPVPEPTPTDDTADSIAEEPVAETAAGPGITVTIQFDTPSASAVANTESLVRGVPGVRSAGTTSLALGGVSLMRVVFDGDPAALAGALQARGWQVFGSGQTLRIRRAPQLLPPDLPPDTRPAG